MRFEAGAARFDGELDAWILSSYADVAAALREPLLSAPDATAHVAVREAATRALPAERLAAWRAEIEPEAHRMAGSLPGSRAVDLVSEFAAPWSLALAVRATGASPGDVPRLAGLAREIFLAAACATGSGVPPRAGEAAAELAWSFPGGGASAAVQTFVALSQTLPCFLGNAWLELFRHPEEAARLRAQPALMPQAMEELLRYASPSRAVFRQASAPVAIGQANIGRGERVTLMLSAANRDAAQFPEPDRLDFDRGGAGHLAFGGGPHSCSGAALIRLAAGVATAALLDAAESVELSAEPMDWIGGFAIRAPARVMAALGRGGGRA